MLCYISQRIFRREIRHLSIDWAFYAYGFVVIGWEARRYGEQQGHLATSLDVLMI